jgi:hypothetical protein
MKVAMVQYWVDERGEPDISKAWMKAYEDSNLSQHLESKGSFRAIV